MSGDRPQYTKYRARPSLPSLPGLRRRRDEPPSGPPPGPPRPGRGQGPERPGVTVHRRRPRISPGRVAKWVVLAVLGWVVLSLALFLVSAQIQQAGVDDEALSGGGGYPLTSANNVLVLGSDTRPDGTGEAGASTQGAGRSDTILLIRAGGGANSRLAVARDTLVPVPGAGIQKANAASAIGGTNLAVTTIGQYLGIPIHHVIQVSFEDFPDLVDAMGGIDYRGPCVFAEVNGGNANGGVTLRIRRGRETRLGGRRTLALARVRKNDCAPQENDLARAARQQRILAQMKSRVIGLNGFLRAPFISWQVPRTVRTDMSGPTLLGLFAALSAGGTPATSVLGTPSGAVPEELRSRAVAQFLEG